MKIIHKDLKNGEIKFKVTKLDDLWYLSHMIYSGDLLKGKTVRKLEFGDKKKKEKKTVFLEIKVDKTDFTTNTLRVGGTVTQGPEDVSHGSHHSFSLEEGSIATLVKEKWSAIELDKLDESIKEREDILIVVFDRENATFALLKSTGYEIIAEMQGEVEKKAFKTDVKDFYAEILKLMNEYVMRYKINRIVVGSPSIWKENFAKILTDELKSKIIWANCSTGEKKGVSEVIKRDEIKSALKEERISTEIRLVEQLLAEIAKQGKVAYGLKEVKEKTDAGAVGILLVTDSFLKKEKEENRYEDVDNLLQIAEQTKSKIYIIKGDHEGGKKLDGLGGIAALLRY